MIVKTAGGIKRTYLFSSAALVFLFFLSLSIGRYPISFLKTLNILTGGIFSRGAGWTELDSGIVFGLRLPRVLMALFSGAGLGICGAVYQGVFRNPLASPGIIGVSAGSGFGAALGILLFGWGLHTQLFAFIFGAAALIMTYTITRKTRANSLVIFVLAGVIVNMFFQALTSLVKLTADSEEKLPGIVYWLMGSLSGVTPVNLYIAAPVIMISSIFLLLMRWNINAISLGEETAQSLGQNTRLVLILVLLFTTLSVSAVVSAAGIVGWLGLIVPHIVRMVIGPDHRHLMPLSALFGAGFFLLIDDFARSVSVIDIPIGILTAVIGAPVFIILLIRSHGEWRL